MAPGGSGPEPRHLQAVRLSLRLGVQEELPALRVQPHPAADAAPSEEIHAASLGTCPRLRSAPVTR